jgi:hypothetical protein
MERFGRKRQLMVLVVALDELRIKSLGISHSALQGPVPVKNSTFFTPMQ